ncbi:MAG: hypothetical protein ACYTGN_13260 [Planctomycetota bacterium]|jgi:hypothetical protein
MKRILLLLALAWSIPACDSAEDLINNAVDLPEKLKTMNDCLEPVWNQVQEVATELSEIMGGGPDAAGTITDTGAYDAAATSINITSTLSAGTMTIVIKFYHPDGAPYAGLLTGLDPATDSLETIMDAVATQMGKDHVQTLPVPNDPNTRPFMIAEWSLSGGLTGGGNMCGVIGGADEGHDEPPTSNELQELRTTEATPAGGIPPIATSTINLTGANSACGATLRIDSLLTDQVHDENDTHGLPEEYPDGQIFLTVTGTGSDLDVTITFNGPTDPIAVIDIVGVPGQGKIDLSKEPPEFDLSALG